MTKPRGMCCADCGASLGRHDGGSARCKACRERRRAAQVVYCLGCLRRPRVSRGSLCQVCRAAIAARGERWCNACRRPVPRLQYGGTRCLDCDAREQREKRARATPDRLCPCGNRRAWRSELCYACHARLRAQGRRWCGGCKASVAARDYSESGKLCYSCYRVRQRARRRAA